MSRGFPSMTALLGLLAIAGYQNRDKLAEMLGGAGPRGPGGATPGQQGGQQGGLGGLLEQFKGAGVGGLLGGGLGELVDRFKQAGQGEVAEFLGRNRTEQVRRADRPRAGDRAGCDRRPLAEDRAFARRASGAAVARSAEGRRPVHAGRPPSGRLGADVPGRQGHARAGLAQLSCLCHPGGVVHPRESPVHESLRSCSRRDDGFRQPEQSGN